MNGYVQSASYTSFQKGSAAALASSVDAEPSFYRLFAELEPIGASCSAGQRFWGLWGAVGSLTMHAVRFPRGLESIT
jgi:hypothetical protein